AYFITFLVVIPAGIAIDIFASTPGLTSASEKDPDRLRLRHGARSGFSSAPPSLVRPGVVAVLLLIANVGYGQWRLHQTATLAPGPRILAIQTNLPQDNKIGWSIDQ